MCSSTAICMHTHARVFFSFCQGPWWPVCVDSLQTGSHFRIGPLEVGMHSLCKSFNTLSVFFQA